MKKDTNKSNVKEIRSMGCGSKEPTDDQIRDLSKKKGLSNRLHLLDRDDVPEPRGFH